MVTISFEIPRELAQNVTIRKQLWNAAYFVRDLWLARSPYASGEYAKGLLKHSSVSVKSGKITITNSSQIASIVEYGRRSFNIGLKMLQNGKNVRVGKDGYRYKRIKIDDKDKARYRSDSQVTAAKSRIQGMRPIGFPNPKIDRYGKVKTYKPMRALQRPLKPGKVRDSKILVVSEKAIRQNPRKWQVPAMKGKFLARDVQKEARPYIAAVIRETVKAERARQQRQRGKNPRWYKPGMLNSLLRTIPAEKPRK